MLPLIDMEDITVRQTQGDRDLNRESHVNVAFLSHLQLSMITCQQIEVQFG